MTLKLDDKLVVGISSRALFDLEEENKIFETEGLEAFAKHEQLNAQKPLPEGPFAKMLKTISIIQRGFEGGICSD